MDKRLKVALVHDYLIDFGGAEQVLLALHEIYPGAPIYVSLVDKKGMGAFWKKFEHIDIRPSWFNSIPQAQRLISPLRFMLPFIWGSFDLSSYDVIIDSSSWAITRGFKTKQEQKEICYCHTPPRYLYGYDTSRNWKEKWFGALVGLYAFVVNRFMRTYDFTQAQKVDCIVANSENTAKRVKKFWKRESVVVYPPVDVENIIHSNVAAKKGEYFLTGGRLVAAKNFDLIIKACMDTGTELKIFGSGVLESELRSLSDSSIEFLGKISDEERTAWYKGAKGFIVAQQDEDFGITLVEAQAAGCPVIAYRGGGYLETVIEGKTGLFFDKLTGESLAKTLASFKSHPFSKSAIRTHATRFSKEVFQRKMKEIVEDGQC